MEELIQLIGKSYGVMGLIMLSPFAGMAYVWKHALSQGKEIKALNSRLEELHEKRTNDAKLMSDKFLELVGEQAASNKEISISLDQVRELLSRTVTGQEVLAHQNLRRG